MAIVFFNFFAAVIYDIACAFLGSPYVSELICISYTIYD